MSNTAREEAMAKGLDSLWSLYREVEGMYAERRVKGAVFGAVGLWAMTSDQIEAVIYTSKEALHALEELSRSVLGDGGVHGSPDRAWEVWSELAISTGDTLSQAAAYGERWSLTGYIKSAGQVLLDTAQNIGAGASSINSTIQIVAVVVGLYFVLQLARGGKAAAA